LPPDGYVDWISEPFGCHTSAECLKAARADVLHEVLRKDASTRIPSAEEQYLEFLREDFG
jgi:hypothetical protein